MLTSVKILNRLEPPNVIQVFNDGIDIFNSNIVKVSKWDFDAFSGKIFGVIESEDVKIYEDDIFQVRKYNKLKVLNFIKTGGTIDSEQSEDNSGLVAKGDFTGKYLHELRGEYFDKFEPDEINPKDSSLFNPTDWITLLTKIGETGLAEPDLDFNWNILPVTVSPFLVENPENFGHRFRKVSDTFGVLAGIIFKTPLAIFSGLPVSCSE